MANSGPNVGLMFGWPKGTLEASASRENFLCEHNADIRGLDTICQLSVEDKDLTSPPGSPDEGDRYIVGASATGAWSGHDDDIAVWYGAWIFFTPKHGWLCWVRDEDSAYVYSGTAWTAFGGGGGGGGTQYVTLHARDLYDTGGAAVSDRGTTTSSAHGISVVGTSDRILLAYFVVPAGATSLTSIKVLYCNTSTSGNNFVLQPGLKVVSDASDLTQAVTTAAKSIITPPTTVDEVDIVTLNTPSESLAAGNWVRLYLSRPASSDSDDTNTNAMFVIGILLTFSG